MPSNLMMYVVRIWEQSEDEGSKDWVRWSYNELKLNVFTKAVVLGSYTVWKISFSDVSEERLPTSFRTKFALKIEAAFSSETS
jgi:hypothetical protein